MSQTLFVTAATAKDPQFWVVYDGPYEPAMLALYIEPNDGDPEECFLSAKDVVGLRNALNKWIEEHVVQEG
jgi:hypothetical protein